MGFTINKLPVLKIAVLATAIILLFVMNTCTKTDTNENYRRNRQNQVHELLNYSADEISRFPGKVLANIKKADSIAYKINDSNLICRINLEKSKCYLRLEQYDSSLMYVMKCLKLAQVIKNDTLLAKANSAAGNIYGSLNDFVAASIYYSNALDLAESIQNPVGEAGMLNNLGTVYEKIGEIEKSIECYRKAVDIFDSIRNDYGIAIAYGNLISIYTQLNDSTNIMDCYTKAYSIFDNLHDTLKISKLMLNVSIYYQKAGNLHGAVKLLTTVIENARSLGHKGLYALALNNLGSLYIYSLNDPEIGKVYIDSSLRISQETSNLDVQMRSLSALSDIEKKLGNYKLALDYYRKHMQIKDSIIGGDVKKVIVTNDLQNKINNHEYEAKLLRQQIDIKSKQNLILYISIFSILLLTIMLGLIIRASYKSLKKSNTINTLENQRLEERLELDRKTNEMEKLRFDTEMETKKKELVSHSLQLITKNDLLNQISKLSEKYYNNNTLDRQYFNELSNIIDTNYNQEKEWSRFKKLFEKVHHKFFNNLKKNYPGLTEHELRFCAYMKIGLQTKEIARLLNISPNAVRTFRYRLKKKLGLNPETSLEEFLRSC